MLDLAEIGDRRSQRVVARNCEYCRAPFEPVRPHQKFCRPSCRWESFKAQRPPDLLDMGYVEPDPGRPD